MKVDACFEEIKIRWIWMAPAGKGKWLSRGFANFLFADHTSGIASNGVVIVRSNQNRIDAPALVSLPVD